MPASFTCAFEGCDATFARDEHLTRHERTHSQERPFHCTLGNCDKWFSRLDNVRQHVRGQHKVEVESGQADAMIREMNALRKRLSVEATTRRRAANGGMAVKKQNGSVAQQINAANHSRDLSGRFASGNVPTTTGGFVPINPAFVGSSPVSGHTLVPTYQAHPAYSNMSAPATPTTAAIPYHYYPHQRSSSGPLPLPVQVHPSMMIYHQQQQHQHQQQQGMPILPSSWPVPSLTGHGHPHVDPALQDGIPLPETDEHPPEEPPFMEALDEREREVPLLSDDR